MTRVHGVLLKPGVRLSAPKGISIFFAIPDRLDVIIREIDGVRTTGRFIDGRFRKINEKANAALGRNSSKSSPRSLSPQKKLNSRPRMNVGAAVGRILRRPLYSERCAGLEALQFGHRHQTERLILCGRVNSLSLFG